MAKWVAVGSDERHLYLPVGIEFVLLKGEERWYLKRKSETEYVMNTSFPIDQDPEPAANLWLMNRYQTLLDSIPDDKN